MSHPLWRDLPADIFAGQIIASVIVLTFVAVFLLREWISQNARPGVFEDDDLPPDDQPAQPLRGANVPPAPVQPIQPPMQNRELVGVQPPLQGPPQPRPLIARPRNEGHRVGEMRRRRLGAVEPRRRDRGKARQLDGIEDLDPRSRRRAHLKGRATKTQAQSEAFTRRVFEARASRRRSPRSDSAPSASPGNLQNGTSQGIAPGSSHFQFTFKPLQPPEATASDLIFGDASSADEVDDKLTMNNVDARASDMLESEDDPFAQSASDVNLEDAEREVSTGPRDDSAEPSSLQDSDYASDSLYDFTGSESYEVMEVEAGPSNLGSHFQGRDDLEHDASEALVQVATTPKVGEDDASNNDSDTQSEADVRDEYDHYFALQDDEQGGNAGVNDAEQNAVQGGVENEPANLDQRVEQHLHHADEEEDDEDEMPSEEEDEEEDEGDALGADRAEVPPQDGAAGDDLNQNGIAIGAEQVIAVAGAAGAEANDELDGNVEDDMEGAMEG